MNQEAFDKIVADFQKHATSKEHAENIEGLCNALTHKMSTVAPGVNLDAAKDLIQQARAGKLKAEPKKPKVEAPKPIAPVIHPDAVPTHKEIADFNKPGGSH